MIKNNSIFSLILFSLFFTSCLTVDAAITLNKNGSGTANFVSSVSTLAADIANIDSKNEILTFPLMREDFDTAALDAGGIQILKYDMTSDGSRYFIDSEVSFNSLNSLSIFTGIQFQLENTGNNSLLTIIVYDIPVDNEISEQAMNLIRNNFPGDSITFTILIPGDIIKVEGATFSGSEVSFNISVEELIQSTESVQFSVEYR
jgi:hypothetical protein